MTEPIKAIKAETWFIDTEYVPCIQTGRRVYGLDSSITDNEVLQIMYEQAGATADNPTPMLKSIMYRIVSFAAVVRKVKVQPDPTPQPPPDRYNQPREPRVVKGDVELHLVSRPTDDNFDEKITIEEFFRWIAERKAQIVGFASSTFDIPTLFQRAVVLGIEIPEFCERPEKPWDPQPDYFSDKNAYHVDLMRVLGSYGKGTPKLAEIARACGIPAKVGGEGADVARMWFDGRRRDIVNYNECDALTTYLTWLHTARTCGLLSGEDVEAEGLLLLELLEREKEAKPHLQEFLNIWTDLQSKGTSPGPIVEPEPVDEQATADPEQPNFEGWSDERRKLYDDAWDDLVVFHIGDEVAAIESLGGRQLHHLSDAELRSIIERKGAPAQEVHHAKV